MRGEIQRVCNVFFFSQFNETILFANFTDVNSMIGMSGAMALLSLQSN